MFDVTALGEVLIDFTACGTSESGKRLFEQNPGGAPANVACAIARLGGSSAFIGKVGTDMHGAYLIEVLNGLGVNTSGLIQDPDTFTTLAFVELSANGERSFSFARKPGADTMLKPEELKKDILENSKILHVGSLSLTHEPARSATLDAISMAKEAGKIISYDPNYRAMLWNSREEAETSMRSLLPYADVIKISDEETVLLTGEEKPEKASEILISKGISLVLLTLGSKGAMVRTKDGIKIVPCPKAPVVDTTGAGDSFFGAYLSKLAQESVHPKDLALDQAVLFAEFANAAASLCVGKRGAIGALPTLNEVEDFLRK